MTIWTSGLLHRLLVLSSAHGTRRNEKQAWTSIEVVDDRCLSIPTTSRRSTPSRKRTGWVTYLVTGVWSSEETKQLTVQLTPGERDVDQLRRYRRAINSDNAIIEDRSKRYNRIGDQKFAEHHYEKGLTETKRTDGSLPDLSSWELRRPFVRGLADADGYYAPDKWTITASNDLRLKRLETWIPVELDIVRDEVENRSWAYLRTSRTHRITALYGWLFPRRDRTEPAMPRKKDVAFRVLETAQ